MQFVRKILRKLKKIPDMKKEKVYNEAVKEDEKQTSEGGNPSGGAASDANVSDAAAEETAKMADDDAVNRDADSSEQPEAVAQAVEEAVAEWKDKFLRLQAEFDNYRKRTLKEKMDLVQTGGRDVLLAMLPVRDDVQRAVAAMEKSDDVEALRQGDRTEGGAQFISDLAPAVKGGELLCRRALEVLDQHYMEADLSLVSLSGLLDVSPNHLSACIKKYTGETFINILIRKRMEAARELLSASGLKVQEVSQRCGYTDQHYFSYCFKKYCGESPNAMRRRLEQERAGERP